MMNNNVGLVLVRSQLLMHTYVVTTLCVLIEFYIMLNSIRTKLHTTILDIVLHHSINYICSIKNHTQHETPILPIIEIPPSHY